MTFLMKDFFANGEEKKTLFDRNPPREDLETQMRCMLYLKIKQVRLLETIKFLQLDLVFRSNCFDKKLSKVFIIPAPKVFPHFLIIKLKLFQILLSFRNLRENSLEELEFMVNKPFRPTTHTIRQSLFRAFDLSSHILKKKSVKMNSNDLFVRVNTRYVIIPNNQEVPFWKLSALQTLWKANDLNECKNFNIKFNILQQLNLSKDG